MLANYRCEIYVFPQAQEYIRTKRSEQVDFSTAHSSNGLLMIPSVPIHVQLCTINLCFLLFSLTMT